MESVVNGKVGGVTGREVGSGRTIYDIALSDGNSYSTFKLPMAQKAQAYSQGGQEVSAKVKVEQKGDYTNLYLQDIGPLGSFADLPSQQIPGAPIQGGAPIPMASNNSNQGGGARGFTEADKTRITRLATQATAYAAVFQGLFAGAGQLGSEEFEAAVATADNLAAHLATKARSHETEGNNPTGAVPVDATPAQVAEAVNTTAGEPVTQVGPAW